MYSEEICTCLCRDSDSSWKWNNDGLGTVPSIASPEFFLKPDKPVRTDPQIPDLQTPDTKTG